MGATVAVSAATVSRGSGFRKLGSPCRYKGRYESGGSRIEHIDRDLKPRASPVVCATTILKTILRAFSAINCLPAGTAPKQPNQRRASSLSIPADGRMAQVPPRLPFGMPRSRPSGRKAFAPRAPKPVPRTVDTASCQKLLLLEGQLET